MGGIRVNITELSRYAAILNYIKMTIPFMYLGILKGSKPRKMKKWKSVILKIKKTLAMWKGRQLSFAERVIVIISIIIALPLFFLYFFKAPKLVTKEITNIQRQFLCGWRSEERK